MQPNQTGSFGVVFVRRGSDTILVFNNFTWGTQMCTDPLGARIFEIQFFWLKWRPSLGYFLTKTKHALIRVV